MKYLIVVEKTETGFSAYSPDVPGCVSTGRTEEETETNMKARLSHVDGLKQEGLPVPQPSEYFRLMWRSLHEWDETLCTRESLNA